MNIRLIKCALLLALCAVNVRGWAQSETVIFSEDFSELTDGNQLIHTYNGWTYYNARYLSSISCLRIDDGNLTSPILNFSNAFTITFDYANGNQNTNDLITTITITSGDSQLYQDTFEPKNYYSKNYKTMTIPIDHGARDISITISKTGSNGLFIKNFKISTSTYTLSESWNNSYAISAQTGKEVDVTIDRTFTANIWNTLCLPFNLETDKAKSVWGDDVKLRVFSSVEDNTMIFTAPENNTVSAGTPFLLKLSNVSSNPSFSGVTISSTAAQRITKSEGNSDYSFIGTYSPITIATTDLFLKSDGNLYHPSGTNLTLNGLRAYFTLPTVTSARLSISNDDGTATVITPSTIHHPLSSETYYTLDGCRVDAPTANGIYIVREADGTTHKVFIK